MIKKSLNLFFVLWLAWAIDGGVMSGLTRPSEKIGFKYWWSGSYGVKQTLEKVSFLLLSFCDIFDNIVAKKLPRFVLMMIVFGTENPSSLWAWLKWILKYKKIHHCIWDRESQLIVSLIWVDIEILPNRDIG